jgi:hypothetical protein
VQLTFDPNSIESYRQFLAVKKLPSFKIRGRLATFPDEYASQIGKAKKKQKAVDAEIPAWMYDYQKAITEMAIRKQKFAIFADCGLGKTPMMLCYARHVFRLIGDRKRVVIITPPMVVRQMLCEAERFFPETKFEQVRAANLQEWLNAPGDAIGITNYEALKDETSQGCLGCLILDEASILKSHYGKYGQVCLDLGRGLDWKLTATGTPAPNDRIEYANQAVFLDRFPTINSFLAKFFINRGQTQERWALKNHAIKPFYRSLTDWSIFLTDPAVYGWKDNCGTLPPINVTIHDVPLTPQQEQWIRSHTGELVATRAGGIVNRSAFGQVAKGNWKGERFDSNKPEFIRDLIKQWPDESTLVWCLYDNEQNGLHKIIESSESLDGSTPIEKRVESVERFKSGESKTLISKPQILGFGLNLQKATRQVFSGLQDSYEKYYQCVKRSNRIGSTKPLNVHIPVTELEVAMVENVIQKAGRIEQDTREQEQLFRESML